MPTVTDIYRICKFILPHNQRLILDPENITHPSCFAHEDYGETLALLQTCRQIRNEVIPLLYSRNAVTVIKARDKAVTPDPLETTVGTKAYHLVKSLDLGMSEGLEELGYLWQDVLAMDQLEKLKFVYYHGNPWAWVNVAAEMMVVMSYETKPLEDLDQPEHLELRVEMFESVDVPAYPAANYTTKLDKYIQKANVRTQVYSFGLPARLKSITISASVSPQAAFAFATYRRDGWRFNSPAGPSTDTRLRKTLVWEKEQKDLQDTAL